ncbi:peroxide stress protein YaaA [Bifidobacterium sp. ESL0790]|uniref:YaaA family protein n=1 Tax=Bifidobacterium sp. ESL0790 TaxID=2983233 RepID=UPI0023F92A4E|nr:peroxide stress protein YaaA [Bifidobacterium sp. ESL0790]WEV73060.1 peroxide stress protein YaaA [Bifidobacterium sp. ESL0790]
MFLTVWFSPRGGVAASGCDLDTLVDMHLLLPPSEGKSAPADGPAFDMDRLSFPELNESRETVLSALIEVSRRDDAAKILKVRAKGSQEIIAQRDMLNAPCAPAREVYTGVLYEAAKLRHNDDVLIFSGLFGVTSGEDPIPSYRLSMNVSLPSIGPLKTFWRKALAGWSPDTGFAEELETPHQGSVNKAIGDMTARQESSISGSTRNVDVTVDLRSELYRVTKPALSHDNGEWYDVRIANSHNKTVSHMAKHYRGLLTRALLDSPTQSVVEVARTLGAVTVEHESGIRHLTLVPFGL